jgi:hypothetical protein
MSFDRVKPFAEAITGAHMGPTPSWARSLRSYRGVNTRLGSGENRRRTRCADP